MLLAQLTDTHVVDSTDLSLVQFVDNNDRLRLAVDRLNAESVQPEAVLATGDLTDSGSEAELAELTTQLDRLNAPLLALPGNHDVRDGFREAFAMPWADNHLSWVVELNGLRIIGLDTLLPGSHGGIFDAERAEWLTNALNDSGDNPTVIAMHHPPFNSGIGAMDRMGLEGKEQFANVVANRPNLTRIFCGHLHRPMTSTVGGVTTTVCLSTVHHVELNFEPDAPLQVICDPGGYQLHRTPLW